MDNSAKYSFTAESSSFWVVETGRSRARMWRSRSMCVRRQCSRPFESRTMRLQNLGWRSMTELRTWDLMESTSNGFFNPTAQWITWFISGRTKSRPAGVTGSSASSSTEPISLVSLPRKESVGGLASGEG